MKTLNNNYEVVSTSILASVEDLFTSKRVNGVLSFDTAAAVWGFSNKVIKKIDLTFPKSAVSKDIQQRKDYFNTHQQVAEKYSEGIELIDWEGKKIRIYCPERTIVEIIKQRSKKMTDIDIETIKSFFEDTAFDEKKLEYFTKKFNVEFEVNFIRRVINA